MNDDAPTIAFQSSYGYYELMIILIELKNIPAFMDHMNRAIKSYLFNFTNVIIKDIMIYSIRVEEENTQYLSIKIFLRE